MPLTIHLGSDDFGSLIEELFEEIRREWMLILDDVFRQIILPAFRRITPQRTGALRASLYIERRERNIAIHVGMPGETCYEYQLGGTIREQHQRLFEDLMTPLLVPTLNAAIERGLA